MIKTITRPKKMSDREEIIQTKKQPKINKLPSGKVVKVNYLAFFLVREIYKSSESTVGCNKERIFAEKVIKWMLRDNKQQDLNSFSAEDQCRLIEIAVEEWGCVEEYKALGGFQSPEIRFFQAVNLQYKKLVQQLTESFKPIIASIPVFVTPLVEIKHELTSSLKGILDQCDLAAQINDTFGKMNFRAIEQFKDINNLVTPIIGLSDVLALIHNSLTLPYQNILLTNFAETLSSYQTLMKNVLPIERFSILPETERYYPTIEMHNTAIVTERLINNTESNSGDVIILPNIAELVDWLRGLNPTYEKLLQGAKEAIYSENPDHCRHFASSCRELSTLLLHQLSPNDLVKEWESNKDCYKDDQPKRKTRLKFIARNHTNKPFIEFLIRDFESQMELLNADEHRIDQEYTEIELQLIYQRFISTLNFLRQIVISQS